MRTSIMQFKPMDNNALDRQQWMVSHGSYGQFKVLGLALYGTTEETFIQDIKFGNQSQLRGYSEIPAALFTNGAPWAEVAALVDRIQGARYGDLEPIEQRLVSLLQDGAVRRDEKLNLRHEFDTLEYSNTVQIAFRGPLTAAVGWGGFYRPRPNLRARIMRLKYAALDVFTLGRP